jgi:hypothetical protein
MVTPFEISSYDITIGCCSQSASLRLLAALTQLSQVTLRKQMIMLMLSSAPYFKTKFSLHILREALVEHLINWLLRSMYRAAN